MNVRLYIRKGANYTRKFVSRYGADIFSILAGIGVVATGITAFNAGRCSIDECGSEEVSKRQNLRLPIIFGSTTIACIAGARYCGKLREESLLAACSVLALYSQRKDRERDSGGDTKTEPIYRDTEPDTESTGTGELLFVEDLTGRRFTASVTHVKDCIQQLQDEFERHNFVPLNSFYGYLGISTTSAGDILGWSVNQSILDPYLNDEDYDDMKYALTDLGIMVRYYEGLGYVIHYPVMPVGGLAGVGPCNY